MKFYETLLPINFIKSVDGSRLDYLKIGNPLGPKVILVHGFMNMKYTWIPYIIDQLHRFQFVIPDLRGHGMSQDRSFDSKDPFGDIGEDLASIVNNEIEEGEEVHFVAFSMGTIASLYAINKLKLNVGLYLHIDHPFDWGLKATRREDCMFGDHYEEMIKLEPEIEKEFLKKGKENPKWLFMASDKMKKLYKNFHLILLKSALEKGMLTTYPFIKKTWDIVGDDFVNELLMITFSGSYGHWSYYTGIAGGYADFRANLQRDYQAMIQNMKADKKVFFVGLKNGLFSPDYNLSQIRKYAPDAEIHVFEKSGHELMLTEFFKFKKLLTHELRELDAWIS